jgi:hypothetical protein
VGDECSRDESAQSGGYEWHYLIPMIRMDYWMELQCDCLTEDLNDDEDGIADGIVRA